MNHPPVAQSGDDIACTLNSAPGFWGAWATYLGFCWRNQKRPWCCPDSPAPICCPGSHHTGFLQCWLLFLCRLKENCVCLYPPWSWGRRGGAGREGHVPWPFSALWLECCEECSILCVREIPLAFCVRAGFTGNRSLMKTFLAQYFFSPTGSGDWHSPRAFNNLL